MTSDLYVVNYPTNRKRRRTRQQRPRIVWYVGGTRLATCKGFVLNESNAQFGANTYKENSEVFMGMSLPKTWRITVHFFNEFSSLTRVVEVYKSTPPQQQPPYLLLWLNSSGAERKGLLLIDFRHMKKVESMNLNCQMCLWMAESMGACTLLWFIVNMDTSTFNHISRKAD